MRRKDLTWGPKFFKYWYQDGGAMETLFGGVATDEIKKALGPWDAPTSPYTYYFEPKFSLTVQAFVDRHSEVWKLLPKTTFQAEGDSLKYFESDLSSLVGLFRV